LQITERIPIIFLANINNLLILIALKEEQQKLTTFGEIDPKEHPTLVNMALGYFVALRREALLPFLSSN
jgi:hypothetical protein